MLTGQTLLQITINMKVQFMPFWRQHLPCVCTSAGLPSLGTVSPPAFVAEVAPPGCSSVAGRGGRVYCVSCSSHFAVLLKREHSRDPTRRPEENQTFLDDPWSLFHVFVTCSSMLSVAWLRMRLVCPLLLAVVATSCFRSLTLFNCIKPHLPHFLINQCVSGAPQVRLLIISKLK